MRGRILDLTDETLTLRNREGVHRVPAPAGKTSAAKRGDWVELTSDGLRVLTPNRRSDCATPWTDHVLDPRRLRGIESRSRVEAGIRAFFRSRAFLETRTPLVVPCPGMETDIRPFEVRSWAEDGGIKGPRFLPTSPEFAMKRLLVGGLERIFQIAPAFRDEPHSTTHVPEFTLLEWYRAHAGYEDIMRDTEELFEALALELFGKPEIRFQGRTISVKTPWPRLRVRDLFQREAGVDLVACAERAALARECARLRISTQAEDTWNDLYFRIWLNVVEPRLPADRRSSSRAIRPRRARSPSSIADPDGSRWARRFELYAGGIELGNAFEELTDPVEQRERFVRDMEARDPRLWPPLP